MAPTKASGKTPKRDADRNSARKRAQGTGHRSPISDEKLRGGDAQKASRIPIELQQLLIDVFKDCLSNQIGIHLLSLIQEVKQHLFNRDFDKAFGSQKYLGAYAIRWSPSRTLAYLDIFINLPDLRHSFIRRANLATRRNGNPPTNSSSPDRRSPDAQVDNVGNSIEPDLRASSDNGEACKVVCLGGGAGAEIVALAGYAHHLRSTLGSGKSIDERASTHVDCTADDWNLRNFILTTVDIADWSLVVHDLYQGVTQPLHLSQFASSAAKAANKPLVAAEGFSCAFHQQDLLELGIENLAHILKDATMVTLMFTLNELYSVSMAKTTNFLLALTFLLETGTLLLVVDSPGSYSTVAVGSSGATSSGATGKKYPMQWLLDHTLLEASRIGSSKTASEGGQWEKLLSEDSRWFRVPEGLKYPVTLENMRYQVHLYRRK